MDGYAIDPFDVAQFVPGFRPPLPPLSPAGAACDHAAAVAAADAGMRRWRSRLAGAFRPGVGFAPGGSHARRPWISSRDRSRTRA